MNPSSVWLPWGLRARWKQRSWRHNAPPREEFVRRFAPGRSFADIGAMWGVDGAIAFLAEECGAAPVTAVDLMPPTDGYVRDHERRSSRVRFVQGDLHDPSVVDGVGPHQVVWCSGVLYHAPNPVLTLERLRSVTTETLILSTETIPEVPGLAQACVFWPAMPERDRRLHTRARGSGVAVGLDTAFEIGQAYHAWWWGMSRSAVSGMLRATGFDVREAHGGPLHSTFIATPV